MEEVESGGDELAFTDSSLVGPVLSSSGDLGTFGFVDESGDGLALTGSSLIGSVLSIPDKLGVFGLVLDPGNLGVFGFVLESGGWCVGDPSRGGLLSDIDGMIGVYELSAEETVRAATTGNIGLKSHPPRLFNRGRGAALTRSG